MLQKSLLVFIKMNKTKNLIKLILEEKKELNSVQIMKELEKKNYQITNDTLAKNLKKMTDSGVLTRHGEKKEGDIAWYHYYQLNEEYNKN